MHVAFVWRGSVRVEVEAAPPPFAGWWRARVVGTRRQPLARSLPWSYGASEDGAIEAAVRLWEHARERLAGG